MSTSRPLRIMRIIARLNIGGPAIHVTLLSERLGPPEFESMLVCGTIGPGEGDMSYLAQQHGIEPVIIPALGRELSPIRDLRTLFTLWRLMRRFRPDIVHTHTAKAGFVGRLAAWLAGVPVRVHTFHGHVLHGYFGPLKTRVFLALERFAARRSDCLITISPSLRNELVHTYHIASEDKFVVVPLGLELAPFAQSPRYSGQFRTQFGIPPSAPLIGIVGRIVPIKNHALFLEAARRVRNRLPDVRFAIVGDGDQRSAVETLVDQFSLRDVVIFTGWQHDLKPVYSDMDTLVISSDNEGTPVSLIEALAAGVPVVSTAIGGVPDLLRMGDWGKLTPPGDAEALAEALITTLSQHDEPFIIRQQVVEEYDITRLARDLATLYRRLWEAKTQHS